MSSTSSRHLASFLAIAALLGGACKKNAQGNTEGILSNGTACQSNSDCQSGICAEASGQSIGFCTIVCTDNTDCTGSGFPKGCCIQPGDNSATEICALAILCSQGDAGLGDPCPNHDECSPGLTCLFDSSNVITECSVSCKTQADCQGVAQECCEGISNNEEFCVIDNMCSTSSGSSTGSNGGSSSGGMGIIVADAGPVSVRLLFNGAEIDDEGGYDASVLPSADVLVAPLPGRYAQLQLPPSLQPGHYSCSDGGGSLMGDGGPTVIGAFTTNLSGSAGPFGSNLPFNWFGLVLPLQCGAGIVVGNPADVMQAATLDIEQFSPGSPTLADGGSTPGHLTGSAIWLAIDTDAGGSLEVIESFDVDLEPAG